ncbi:MAG TPA: GNAT family N-acetyltransferase [Steroidobacteraceae bacterium]|nr:GNAT family N-acetyltransferase [Steroidobacteraceae bacterium]
MQRGRSLTDIILTGGLVAENSVAIETVSTVEGVAALAPSLDRLLEITGNTLPFALPEWHLAWCHHFLNCNPHIREELRFCVLRKASGSCVAIVPLVASRRHLGPLKIESISLLGADPAITELRAPIILPGYEYLTANAVQRHLAAIGGWDWIHWTGIAEPFAAALAVGGRLIRQPALQDFVLDLAPTWEEFRRGLKRNIRESLRHCYNSLKRDHHRFELQVIRDPADVRRSLERFLELHIMRANLMTAEVHNNRFASAVARNFLFEVCERLARRGVLRVFELKIEGKIVASRIGFLVGDSLYLYYSGFDPRWSRYSVMTTTVAEAIKYAISQGLKTVNLSPTKDISKMRWGPRQIDYSSAFELSGRLRSRLANRAYLNLRSGTAEQFSFLRRLMPGRHDWL